MIVLDTSALSEYLIGDDQLGRLVRLEINRAMSGGQILAAPHAVDLEFLSVLRGRALGKKISTDRADAAVALLARMPLRRYGHERLLPRIWELRHNMWPYDAAYIALAEQLGADLVTTDNKLAAAPGLRCAVRNYRLRL